MSEFKNEDRYKNLDRVNTWVANCDAKASYLLTLLGVVFTIIATSGSSVFGDVFAYQFSATYGLDAILRFLEAIALYLCLSCLLKALNDVYHVLFAKIDSSIDAQQGLISNSVLFFGTIEQRSFIDFSNQCKALTEGQLQAQIDSQVYINSKICQLKFKNYNTGLKFCRYAFIVGLVFLVIKFLLLRS